MLRTIVLPIVDTHQVGITAQKTVDIIVWVIVMLAFIRHTHQVGITAQKTVDIIVWLFVMLAFIRHTHQVASKNRRKEPGHSGYFSLVLRKMYITLIFISETTINIYLFFVHIVAFPMIQLYLKTVQYKARY